MVVIADLQLHSKFSRAVSQEMTILRIAQWARRKGIGLVATGDWTHPLWMREIEANLEEAGNGLLRLKPAVAQPDKNSFDPRLASELAFSPPETSSRSLGNRSANISSPLAATPLFMLATEISCIYSQGGKLRRIHILVWVPSLTSANRIAKEMTRRGCNLMSDGRPIIGLSSIQLAELVLSIEPRALIIPAHAWTPWFSVYGSMSGFESIEEAFGPFAKNVYAVETGLSSNPAMNWRIGELDNRAIVSFSDAHSGPKIGREATAFNMVEGQLGYEAIYEAIKPSGALHPADLGASDHKRQGKGGATVLKKPGAVAPEIAYTIEFYPEEGKYHYTGHRTCNVRLSPAETRAKGTTCPVCGKPLTQGVMQRVEELAGRSEADLKLETRLGGKALGFEQEVQVVRSGAFPKRCPFVMLVPLMEIIAESVGSPVASPKVQSPYFRLTDALGGEFGVLLNAPKDDIAKLAGERVAVGVEKVRRGEIVIDPGYDGVFGVVRIWKEGEEKPLLDASKEQLSIF